MKKQFCTVEEKVKKKNMKDTICKVELCKIVINKSSNIQTIVLKETKGNRTLTIGIGNSEVNAIKLEIAKVKPQRPMTHDLLKKVIEAFDATVEKIIIDKLQFSTFHAKIFLKLNSKDIRQIDARPSDSIALALRTKSPIYVSNELLNKVQKFEVG